MMYVLCSGCSKTQQNNIAVTTTDSQNYFVKYFSKQRKNRGDENLNATATT